jgi:ornithine cyclodeaminase
MRILFADDVRATLTMPVAIAAMREGFVALSTGRATVPLRTALQAAGTTFLYMPAHIRGSQISTVKIVGVTPDNPTRSLPVVQASVLVLDVLTGQTLALIDGTSLTAIRTGAASGLATELLARADARVLGVIGTGAQARTQIAAVCAVRPIEQIRLYSRSNPHALADELRELYDAEIIVASSAHDALYGADVLVAATNSHTPVIHAADVQPGAHINGVGTYTHEMQEVAADVVISAKVVVDHRASAWAEAGDLIIPRDAGVFREDQIYAELGEIAAGLKPGRESDSEVTFFKSVGNAVQDAAAAWAVLQAATERGLGTVV